MGNNSSSRRREAPAGGASGPPGAARPNEAAAGGYPGAAAPQPAGPQYVHPNLYGGQRAMPHPSGVHGMFPYMDGSRPPELRGENLYPWRPMPRQMMPQMQKTYTIKNDVNLKKGTLKLVPDASDPARLSVEFDFDTSTECRVTVYFCATEIEGQHAKYATREGDEEPARTECGKGLGQQFRGGALLDTSRYSEEELKFDPQTPRRFPLVIRLESIAASSGASASDTKPAVQSQSTYASLRRDEQGGWACAVLKQTIQVGARSFELQEIYGIDQSANGGSETAKADDLDEDGGRECVICMTEPRDTTVLPCRHMCMCNKCAKVLRLQTNKCPICRCPVDSLLQIKVKGADKPSKPAAPFAPPSAPAAPTGPAHAGAAAEAQ